MKIFLGGTCGKSNWREKLIPYLEMCGIKYFNPVVENWTPECKEIEDFEKEYKCNVHLYVITDDMEGFYSIAEIVDSCHRCKSGNVDKVYFYYMGDKFTEHQLKSLEATCDLCRKICNCCCRRIYKMRDIYKLANYLNASKEFQ